MRTAWRAASIAVSVGFVASAGCANILGLREALDDGDCVLNSDCAPDKTCIFRVCSLPCQADKDCPTSQRCLRTASGAACIDAHGAGCDKTCPQGSVCDTSQNVCRNGCNLDADCLGGQVCTNRVCRGSDTGHDPVVVDSGGARDSTADSSAGSGGTAGTTGSGGSAGAGGVAGSGGAGTTDGAAGTGRGGNAGTGGAAGGGGSGGSSGGAAGNGGTAGSGGTVGKGGAAGGGTGGTVVVDGSTSDAPADATTDRCAPECTLGETRCGVNQGLVTCTSVDGCLQWGSEASCGGRKVCSGSAPTATCACVPRPTGCENGKGTYCSDANTVVECAEDADQCIYKISPVPCPVGRLCTGSHPTASCSCPTPPAECNGQQGTFCESSTAVATCGLDAVNCLAITNRVTCPSGKPCTGSFGAASCSCSPPPTDCGGGAGQACRGAPPGEVVTCGTNSDGCIVITGTNACAAGKPCAGTPPNSSCTCPAPPAICNATTGTFCSDTSTLVTCANDANGCLTISATVGCGAGKQCTGSTGSASCSCLPPPADCPTGNGGTVCRAGNVLATCGLDPATGCVVTTGTTTCSATRPCAGSYPGAACTCPAPPAACTAPGMQNGTYCASSTSAQTCTTTGEGCVNGSSSTCSPGQFCQQSYPNAQCAAPVPIGHYNDLGSAETHSAFYLTGYGVTPANAVTLHRFGIRAAISSGTHRVRMALYETNGSSPGALRASTDIFTLVNGNNDIPPLAGYALVAGTTYFIMAVFETDTDVGHDGTAGTTWHYNNMMSFLKPFPAALNDGTSANTTFAQSSLSNMNFYLLVY
jgi:hypothetical protein